MADVAAPRGARTARGAPSAALAAPLPSSRPSAAAPSRMRSWPGTPSTRRRRCGAVARRRRRRSRSPRLGPHLGPRRGACLTGTSHGHGRAPGSSSARGALRCGARAAVARVRVGAAAPLPLPWPRRRRGIGAATVESRSWIWSWSLVFGLWALVVGLGPARPESSGEVIAAALRRPTFAPAAAAVGARFGHGGGSTWNSGRGPVWPRQRGASARRRPRSALRSRPRCSPRGSAVRPGAGLSGAVGASGSPSASELRVEPGPAAG